MLIGKEPSGLSNGCIAFTQRLKTDFFGRATAAGACRNAAERKASIRFELIKEPQAQTLERQRARGPGVRVLGYATRRRVAPCKENRAGL